MNFMKILSTMVIATLLISLAACGTNTKSNNETSTEKSAVTTTAAETTQVQTVKEPVKLKLLLDNGDDVRKSINAKYIQANMKTELPDFDVEVELVPSGILDKIKVLNATGELPDVFYSQGVGMLPPLIDANSLIDLLPYITKDGFADKYKIKNLIAPWKDGKLYTLDAGTDAYFVPRMFYHKDLLTKYNLNVPVTFDEFMKVCKTLKSKGVIPVALYGKDGWAVNNNLLTMMIIADDAQVYNDLITGKTDFSNPVVQNALNRIITMVKEGVFQTGVTTTEYGAVSELFTTNKAAMYLMNSWELPNMEKIADVDYMNFPQVNTQVDTSKITQIYESPLKGYTACAQSKNPDAAVKLAEYCVMQEATFFNKDQKSPSGLETGVKLEGLSALMEKNLNEIDGCTVKANVITFNLLKAKAITDLGVSAAKLLTGKYTAEQYAKDMNTNFLDGMNGEK